MVQWSRAFLGAHTPSSIPNSVQSQLAFFPSCPAAPRPHSTHSQFPPTLSPALRSLLSEGKPGGQRCCGNAPLVQEPSEKASLRKRSLVQGAWRLEIPHMQRYREGVLVKKKQPVQKAKKATKRVSLVSQSQSMAQMKGMWLQPRGS